MRPWLLALLLTFLTALSGWCQTEQSSTVIEAGDIRDVIAFSGTVSLSERVAGNERESSYSKTLKGKNVSGRPILLLIVAFDCCSNHHAYRWDNFLGQAIQPDEDINFADSETSRIVHPDNPQSPSVPPEATASVLFVQFADGTTLGGGPEAKAALDERAAILQFLRQLVMTYTNSGEEAFQSALSGTFPASASSYIRTYKKVSEEKGAQTAIAMINERLRYADVNLSRLAADQ
jgi:hypothetical protein